MTCASSRSVACGSSSVDSVGSSRRRTGRYSVSAFGIDAGIPRDHSRRSLISLRFDRERDTQCERATGARQCQLGKQGAARGRPPAGRNVRNSGPLRSATRQRCRRSAAFASWPATSRSPRVPGATRSLLLVLASEVDACARHSGPAALDRVVLLAAAILLPPARPRLLLGEVVFVGGEREQARRKRSSCAYRCPWSAR
jgi:hypothetical protein